MARIAGNAGCAGDLASVSPHRRGLGKMVKRQTAAPHVFWGPAMPRFVVLHHQMPPGGSRATHWDLMLEPEGDAARERRLATWALDREPQLGATIAATRLADHRAAYLEYEGEVSGNRGHVTRWDAGDYVAAATADEQLALQISGAKLRGKVTLTRIAHEAWTFSWVS
jgi:hypothetical protein